MILRVSDFWQGNCKENIKYIEVVLKGKIQTSQGRESGRPLTFATRKKCAPRAWVLLRDDVTDGGAVASIQIFVTEARRTGYARSAFHCKISKPTQAGDGYNVNASGASP